MVTDARSDHGLFDSNLGHGRRPLQVTCNTSPGHGITKQEVEEVLEKPAGTESSRSSGRPIVFGDTSTGRIIAVVYEEIDQETVYPVTAYEVEP